MKEETARCCDQKGGYTLLYCKKKKRKEKKEYSFPYFTGNTVLTIDIKPYIFYKYGYDSGNN